MKEIREVAKAYYNGAELKEKRIAQLFFQKLDEYGNGKVSLASFKRKGGPSFPCTDHNFRLLDENGDGTLDFDEVLALYYMTKVPITTCSACSRMLLASYFSCLRCQGKSSYTLCCHCYSRRNFRHQHPSDDFADNRAQLTLLEQLLGQEQVPRNRRDIFNQKSHGNIGEALRDVVEVGLDGIDPEEIVKLVADMMNNEEEEIEIENKDEEEIATDEGFDIYDGIEAVGEGIDVNDVAEAVGQGIDILDAVGDMASIAASCSIM